MRSFLIILIIPLVISCSGENNDTLLIEAESFEEKGGWLVDPQFTEQMGSPYLLAHGIGTPVRNAKTIFEIKKNGNYHIWVRTKNWAPGEWDAPGRFQLKVDNQILNQILRTEEDWGWQYAGRAELNEGEHQMVLTDLTGFDGRCDAIYLSTRKLAPSN